MNSSGRPYFKSLDVLRFLAFMSVFVGHSFYTSQLDNPTLQYLKLHTQYGHLGLKLFFILSGFLSFFFLIDEKYKASTNILKFYKKKALRIFPLYYMALALAFVATISFSDNGINLEGLLPYIFFYSNMDIVFHNYQDTSLLVNLWAVSVFVHFYLIAPVLTKLLHTNNLLIALILVYLGSQFFIFYNSEMEGMLHFHSFTAAADFAIGGILAAVWHVSGSFRRLLEGANKWLIVCLYLVFFTLLYFYEKQNEMPVLRVVQQLMLGLGFTYIIAEQNFCKWSLFKLGSIQGLAKLGKYTFGFYCYHILCIRAINFLFDQIGVSENMITIIVVKPLFSLIITLLVGLLSFHYFEKRFLNLGKTKHANN